MPYQLIQKNEASLFVPSRSFGKGAPERPLSNSVNKIIPMRRPEAVKAEAYAPSRPGIVSSSLKAPVIDGARASYIESCFLAVMECMRRDVDLRRLISMAKEELYAEIDLVLAEVSKINSFNLTKSESVHIQEIIYNEMFGLGPIEHLLLREDVTEIMVNDPKTIYVEINGIVQKTAVTFRDNNHLITVCQRIACQVGRRADESSPICDARLADGSRVNIILPPLALNGAVLTIRKFQKEKLTLEKLESFGSVDAFTAELIRIIAASRANILVSGGTGSGKTTLLNCLTGHINTRERIITCEDAAELQLQQPHVIRLETRPANLEGSGEVTMRDLVRNCLRMRPERIIVGEVRGPEAFDLLQAMNTGHDGSMGTIHANTPRDALGRLETMIAMTRLNIPPLTIRQQIASSVNIIIQIQRMHDGSRKVTHISEITGMADEVIAMNDLVTFEVTGEPKDERVAGVFKHSGVRPRFCAKLRQVGLEERYFKLAESMRSREDVLPRKANSA